MKFKPVAVGALAAMLAIAPLSEASAHGGGHWHGGGPVVGLFALGAAVAVGTAAVLSAPFNALAAAPEPQVYAPPPPPQAYYSAPPAYYAPPPVAYYPPPRYYSQAPVYYAPPAYYR